MHRIQRNGGLAKSSINKLHAQLKPAAEEGRIHAPARKVRCEGSSKMRPITALSVYDNKDSFDLVLRPD
jgi:hypothetical protein